MAYRPLSFAACLMALSGPSLAQPVPPTPPSPPSPPTYVPYPQTKPPTKFNQPIQSPKEQRFVTKDGKLVTCRNTGPWVYCF